MRALLAPLSELGEYEEIRELLARGRTSTALSGCADSQKLHMIYGLGEGFRRKLIITFNDLRAKELYEDYQFYDRNVMLYPAKDLIFFQADIHGNQLTKERIKVFRRMAEGVPLTVVTTFDALMAPQVSLEDWRQYVISIDRQSCVVEHELAGDLAGLGYVRCDQVEEPGQFSIRGGIVDIFDLTEENPYRIELWGDEVESIRSFDVLSQRSIEKLEAVSIYPATELILSKEELSTGLKKIQKEAKKQAEVLRKQMKTEEAHRIEVQNRELTEALTELGISYNAINLDSYVRYFFPELSSFADSFAGEGACVFLDEPLRIKEHVDAVELEFRESMAHRAEKGYILPGQMDVLFSAAAVAAGLENRRVVSLSSMEGKNPLIRTEQKFAVQARSLSSYNNSFESLVKDLKNYKKKGYRILLLSRSRTRAKRLAEDLRDQEVNAFYTEDPMREVQPGEVMTAYGRVRKGFEYPLLQFMVIAESDIFGAQKKKKRKKKVYEGQKINDFNDLKVGDYVVHESHGLGVYQGIEKVEVEHVVKDYMKISYRDGGVLYVLATGLDVIQKYASADGGTKPKLNKLGTQEWSRTKSKVRTAVEEIAGDLVELYAARQNGKGYCYGPDTVWQREFEEMFPFEETEDQVLAIAAAKEDMESEKIMDRLVCGDVGYGKTEIAIRAAFKAVQENKQVVYLVPTTILAQQHYHTFVQRMKDFPVRVDLLSRFRTAAEQKKTITDLKKGMVDIVIGTHRVLSADVEYKDLGLLIIDEEQRFGVTHKEKIKKLKENIDVLTLTATPIPRTLHMSLVGIRDMSVLEEAPEDRLPIQTNVAFAHGQMKEAELERIMFDFVNGEIDVLVSTTIIETGLDISNVNTIIIHDSDQMGLSQLYQLRGRVGRSNRTAYAFLMYKRDKVLKEVAEKRLEAIREFTELGSGFKIAMRDLEIRGAGSLLGKSQHGHMQAVGYDLYCKMLNEAVKTKKGISVIEDFNTLVDLDVDAYIPPEYIVNEVQKLDIYKRIAGIENERECDDMREELLDRFGQIPKSVGNLLRIALIRSHAHRLYMPEVKGKNERISFTLRPDAPIRVENIPFLISDYGGRLRFDPKGDPTFYLHYRKCGMIEKDEETLLMLTGEALSRMEEVLVE